MFIETCPARASMVLYVTSDYTDGMDISRTHAVDFHSRRMVRSTHLALFPQRFTSQFDFAVSYRYSYEKIHTASLGTARWADLGTRHHIKLLVMW